jgi:hypothetical protein
VLLKIGSAWLLVRHCGRYVSALLGMFVLFMCWSFAFVLLDRVLLGVCGAMYSSRDTYLLLSAALAVLCWFYAGIMVGRFLIRLYPVRSSGRVQYVLYRANPTFLVVFIATLALVNYPMVFGDIRLGTILTAVACDIAILGILYARYASDTVVTLRAVFLRRFSSFADRSLLAACLRSIPPEMTPVVVVSRAEPLRNWDPFALAWAGLKLTGPFVRVPEYIECSNEEWLSRVRSLIDGPCLIFIDVSEVSESIRSEFDLLKTSGALRRTVVLSRADSQEVSNFLRSESIDTNSSSNQVRYQRKLGIGRFLVTFFLSLGSTLTLWLKLEDNLKMSSWLDRLVLVSAVALALAYSFHMFAKRTLTRSSVRAIKKSTICTLSDERFTPFFPHSSHGQPDTF